MTPDEILIAAWLRGAPNALVSRGFPRGFWPDVARTAVEMALAGRTDIELSFRPTMCVRGSFPEEARRGVKGIDVRGLEFKL